ncbi:unnamed protein product, partial [Laminaria digitata]
ATTTTAAAAASPAHPHPHHHPPNDATPPLAPLRQAPSTETLSKPWTRATTTPPRAKQSDGAAPCAYQPLPPDGKPPPPQHSKPPTSRKLWGTIRGSGAALADALMAATFRQSPLQHPRMAARRARAQPCYWPPAVLLVVGG